MTIDLDSINRELGDDTEGLIDWAFGLGERAVVSTSFGPYSAVMLDLLTKVRPRIPVVWVDSGYATPATYRFADELTQHLNLDLRIFHPRRSRAHREAVEGELPGVDDPRHEAFTREVKLEPFDRAILSLEPHVWFTGIRGDETAFRAGLQPVAQTKEGILKVAPLLHWNSKRMHEYVKKHALPNNFDYFDPTKVIDSRECGLHLEH